MKIDISQEEFGTLCICAIRSCHGRQTYIPDLVRSICRNHLHEIPDKDLGVMVDDCGYQRRMNLYGHERIDRLGWLKWEKELFREMERRKNED